ncbi:hypothetical protein DDE82_003886 [Stemphylium lycopersici]|nr:hypothetical protein DDE82_003886 [Stemphylium lycopersici]
MASPFTLPFIPPDETPITHPDITLASTRTGTATSTAATTAFARAIDSLHRFHSWIPHLATILHTLLYLAMPIFYLLTQRRRHEIATDEATERETQQEWASAWHTKDWTTLYGLLALAQENEPMPTPWAPRYLRSMQQRLQAPRRRWALRELLEKGIIPLYIQDGGVCTRQTASWGVRPTFPFVTLPRYRQTKSRAYFDFAVPHYEEELVRQFVMLLCRNEAGHGVEYCRFDPGPKLRRPGKGKPPCAPYKGPGFPLSVGAEAVVESLLPFCPDRVVERAHEGCCPLEWYLKGDAAETIPLLHYVSLCIVRVESGHWGHVELDNCVLNCAQDVGMEDLWPLHKAQRRATRELERLGLAIDQL